MRSPIIEFRAGQTVVFEGDSLTCRRRRPALDEWPWLRLANHHRSWADIFAELCFAWHPEPRIDFRTAAVGGSTCHDVEARLDAFVRPLQPGWIFLTLGTNDAARKIPLAEFREKIESYAKAVDAWSARLVFVLLDDRCPGLDAPSRELAEARVPYSGVLRELAGSRANVEVLDAGAGLRAKAEALHRQHAEHSVYADGLHYNHLGALIIAGEVLRACRFPTAAIPGTEPAR